MRSNDVWFGFALGHSVNAASVCHPGKCSPVMQLPNEAWRPGCRLWEPRAVVRPWNCGQTGGRIQQVRSDTGPIHSERPREETLQRHGNLTGFDPDVTSSLLKSSNYPHFLCKP